MNGSWLLFAGAIAAFLGFANLENARRSSAFRPMTVFWSLIAGYLCYLNLLDLYDGGGAYAMAGFGLAFCAVSPILGWLWWGQHGKIRQRFFQLLLFFSLTAIGLVVWPMFLRINAPAIVALSLFTASLPFLGIRRKFQRARWRWQSRRQRRAQQRAIREQEQQEERQHQEAEATLRRQAQQEREFEAKRQREEEQRRAEECRRKEEAGRQKVLEEKRQREEEQRLVIERRKEQEAARRRREEEKRLAALKFQRNEIVEQIRLVRAAEIKRIQKERTGLRFHPHYGFLMAEAWRVVRARMGRSKRTPAANRDEFFHQIVAELMGPESFKERYFHEQGRTAIATVNRYLEGDEPLSTAREAIERLRLNPSLLAPEPLDGDLVPVLLEAWLIPHRRYQDLLLEEYLQGQHPLQVQLAKFLSGRVSGDPGDPGDAAQVSRQQWRRLWDEHPAEFLLSAEEDGPSAPAGTESPESPGNVFND